MVATYLFLIQVARQLKSYSRVRSFKKYYTQTKRRNIHEKFQRH